MESFSYGACFSALVLLPACHALGHFRMSFPLMVILSKFLHFVSQFINIRKIARRDDRERTSFSQAIRGSAVERELREEEGVWSRKLNLISFARVCPIAPMVDSRSWTTFERATKATAFLCYVTPTEEHSSTSETGTSLQRTNALDRSEGTKISKCSD